MNDTKFRDMKTGAELIAEERVRQIVGEGFTSSHDDEHGHGVMAMAAGCYIEHVVGRSYLFDDAESAEYYKDEPVPDNWPTLWAECWWKPKDPIRDLVRAGALIAAEIDLRLRAAMLKE